MSKEGTYQTWTGLLHSSHWPTMFSFASPFTSGCCRRTLGSHYRAAYWQGHGVWSRSMAAVADGFPVQPGSTEDLDSHLLAALRWSAQKGATLGDLSREFNTNADRVLDIPLPYESTPPLSRRLTFHKSSLSKGHRGVVMVAHCMSSKGGFDRQKARVKLSSGFVIGDGLVVTCAHTFEEVSSSVTLSDKPEETGGVHLGSEVPVVSARERSAVGLLCYF